MFALTSGQTVRDPEEGRVGGRNTPRTGSCIMYRTEYSRYWTPRNIYWPLERRYTPPVPAFIEVRKLAATVRSREQLSRREDASRGIVQRCSSYNSAGIIIIVNRRGQEMESKNPGVGMFAIQRDWYVWGLSLYSMGSRTRVIVVHEIAAVFLPWRCQCFMFEELESGVRERMQSSAMKYGTGNWRRFKVVRRFEEIIVKYIWSG